MITCFILNSIVFPSFAQKVGIGVTTPQAQLHVQITSSYSYPAFIVDVEGSTDPYLIITPDGKVGMGISNPSEKLDIAGNVQFSGALMPNGNAGITGQVLISQGPGAAPIWVDAPSIGDNWGNQVAITQNPVVGNGTTLNPITLQGGTTAGDILVWDGSQWVIQQPGASSGVAPLCPSPSINFLQKWTGTDLCNSIIYDDGTNVGIGVISPTERLDVAGNIKFSGALMPGGNAGTAGFVLTSQGPGVAPTWTDPATFGDNWGSQVAQTQNPVVGDGTSANPITFANGSASGDIWQWDGSSWQLVSLVSAVGLAGYDSVCNSAMNNYVQKWVGNKLCNSVIYDDGTNVGVGTVTPSERLDVAGNIKFSGALMPGGNAGAPGQVLISQGPGVPPQWQNFAGIKKIILISGHGLPVWNSSLNAYMVATKTVTVSANDTLVLIPLVMLVEGWNTDPYSVDRECHAINKFINVIGPGTATVHTDPTHSSCDGGVEAYIVFPTGGTYTIRVLARACSLGPSHCTVDNNSNVAIEILGLLF